jgi:phosphatidylinositol alpha-1,6-mannosyltransferase
LPREDYLIAAGEHPDQDAFDRRHDLRVARLPLHLPAWGVRSWSGLRGYIRALYRLRPLIRSEQVSKVHCGRCLPEGVMALALKCWLKVPYLCFVHGEDVNVATTSREHTFLVRRVLRHAELILANSHCTESLLRQEWGLASEQVHVLHPGVDTERFVPAGHDQTIRGLLGWTGRLVVLTVGRLQKRKGHDQLIRALSVVRQTLPDVLYAIVGEGEEEPALRKLVQSEGLTGHVQFLGEVSETELIRCYQQCDLFVLPNRQVGKDIEGFGMVLLEAQSCGKAVVAGRSGGTAETMSIPETGRVVDCDTLKELANVMSELLPDQGLRERMGRAARSWVLERFDWKPLTRKAAHLFENRRGGQRPRLTANSAHA